jgi:DNA mismatch repair protein MutS2
VSARLQPLRPVRYNSIAVDEHALKTLEFDKVVDRLARHTSFSASRELALSLRPSNDFEEVVRRQRLTAEARRLREMKPRAGLEGARDVRELARKAALGGVLEPSELLDIASLLTAARETHATISRLGSSLPLLAGIAGRIEPQPALVDRIGQSINQRAEVTDAASPMLGILRRDIRTAHDRLSSRLQEILAAGVARGWVQEPIITMRDGRYVIPVKADFRGQIKGVVHDVSSSGATVFLEPLAVVDLANQWRELQLEEQREVERVLRRLSGEVGARAGAIVAAVEALAEIDLALAKARLGDELGAQELPHDGERQAWLTPAPAELHLVNARHPLLKGEVVPVTVTVGGSYRVLLITGPNTGGKTVALKTAGLLTLMACAGLPVPADAGSRVPVFGAVYADIGDEQSIEQSLSTFSSHMTHIIHILREANERSLVLLDELAAGTDPVEGAALARAVLEELLRLGSVTIATTHHGELKAFAHATEGIVNGSVEFDPVTLAPTYRLTIGLPGRSNALAIAERLGLPKAIVESARRNLSAEHVQVESMLAEIQRERREAEEERRSERIARDEAERIRARLEEKLQAIEEERARIIARTLEDVERELADARRALEEAKREAERQRLQRAARRLQEATARAGAARRAAERQVAPRRAGRTHQAPAGPLPEQIQPGDLVWIRGMDRFGEAQGVPVDGEVEIRLGPLRSRIRLDQVERVQRPHVKAGPKIEVVAPPPPTVAPEIEVRGQTLEEALPLVERHLDDAFRAGLATTRVVHGKGTGTLRREIRHLLERHPLVRRFESAEPFEGGEGVTVVHLAV